ncbi:MAG: hypothetical protein OEW39_01580 [Deltaproteobacteria bacterium]|nr:hypothetical protein [Deltaproteobacteria bacterium]
MNPVKKGLSRRQVLRLLGASAAGLAVSQVTRSLALAVTEVSPTPRLIWVNEGGNDQNLLTLLGQTGPDFADLILTHWELVRHDALFSTTFTPNRGAQASAPVLVMETLPDPFLLSAEDGSPWRAMVSEAKAVVLVGTEACYGGLTLSSEQVSAMEAFCKIHRTPLIKLPGMPVPPQHLVGVLAHLEYLGFPKLDSKLRPLMYYEQTICESCERRKDLDAGRFARALGEEGCLLKLGCKGLVTHNSCATTRWNGGENWCVGAGGPCTGCSEPGYPDHQGLGLYGLVPGSVRSSSNMVWENLNGLGYGVLGLATAGVALQWLRRQLFPLPDDAVAKPPPGEGRR